MRKTHGHKNNTDENLDQRRRNSIFTNGDINKAMSESYYWHPDHQEQARAEMPKQRSWRNISGDHGEIFVVAESEVGFRGTIKDVVLQHSLVRLGQVRV